MSADGGQLGDEPSRVPLDISAIRAILADCMPLAAGLKPKTLANIRSNFMAAVKVSGMTPAIKTPLAASWRKLVADLSSKRAHLGLSRFARWCSGQGIEPGQVSDAVLADFIKAVRDATLHRKPNELHRKVALIWNEAVQKSRFELRRVSVPSFRQSAKRMDWSLLRDLFGDDLSGYAAWCAGTDSFAADARPRALAAQTVKLHQNQVHAAVTALVESGISPTAITSLTDLVTVENFRRILRWRLQMVGGRENAFNRDLARTLVEIARRWVKVDGAVLEELKRLASKVPEPLSGLTEKNKAALRQFDDPDNLRRLLDFQIAFGRKSNARRNPTSARW